MHIAIERINYAHPPHARALIDLLDAYAMDPMGGGHPLSAYARQNLVSALAQRPAAFGVIAFAEGKPAGLINCFEGFSTFACKPLVNIHDVMVLPAYRGQGIAYHMLRQVEQIARERGCCKLTLEVLQGNQIAQQLYRTFGFGDYSLLAENGNAVFLQKILPD